MNHIKKDKIQLICYCADDFKYQKYKTILRILLILKIII